jgi:leucyl aminopeptidase
MKITFEKNSASKITSDAFIFLSFEDSNLLDSQLKNIEKSLNCQIPTTVSKDFCGKDSETLMFPAGEKRIILSGLGKKDDFTLEKMRKACARAAKKANDFKLKTIAVEVMKLPSAKNPIDESAKLQVEICMMALYTFDKYLTSVKDKKIKVEEMIFFANEVNMKSSAKEIEKGVRAGEITGNAVFTARDLGNEPSNVLFPEEFGRRVIASGEQNGYEVKVYDMAQLEEKKMGGIIAIGKGSKNAPVMIELRYNGGRKSDAPVAIVGKGVTFDSGGISIKPAAGMEAMKMDMCGAAATVGIFEAVAQLKLKVNLIGIIPSVENMPGGNAIKPGDIITMYNGKTVEVGNTDAEGRVILADALAYVTEFKPKVIIDMATLTGATLIALGNFVTSAMSNDAELTKDMYKAGQATYERIWELPTWDDFDKLIDTDQADMSNMGTPARMAGTIVGGMFLKRYVNNIPWIHFDIAGTAMSSSSGDYSPKYATGVGVRLVTHYLREKYS